LFRAGILRYLITTALRLGFLLAGLISRRCTFKVDARQIIQLRANHRFIALLFSDGLRT